MRIIVLLSGCLFAIHAFAGESPVANRMQAATQLLRVMDARQAEAVEFGAMADAIIKGNPMLGPYRSVIIQWAEKYMSWQKMGPKLAALYSRAFTRAELEDLIRFYETPTGRKAVRVLPELAKEGTLIGETVAHQHIRELQRMIKARTAELEKVPPR